MALEVIAQPLRKVVRRQTAWLLAWACAVGFVSTMLLLHRYGVQSMGTRYAASACAMYLLGWIAGGYVYLRWWTAREPDDASFPVAALPDDIARYREACAERRDRWLSVSRWWDDDDDSNDTRWSRDSTAWERFWNWIFGLVIKLVLSIVLTVLGLVLGFLPLLVFDAMAGVLASVVVQFGATARAVPDIGAAPELGGYWPFVIAKTGLAALVLIAVAGAAGYWLEQRNPGATDLADILLQWLLAYVPESWRVNLNLGQI